MNHLSTEFSAKPVLDYPFKKDWHPKPGKPFEVAKGVFWLRVPLPIALDHINLWLLRDKDGWTIVDTGYDDISCMAVWDTVFEHFLSEETVHRIIVTHYHPDHIGLAGWLARRCNCEVWIMRGEFDHYRNIVDRDPVQYRHELFEYLNDIGFDNKLKEAYIGFFDASDKPEESRVQASLCRFISDGEKIEIDGDGWQVVMGNGHSPEHACLYSANKNCLISGDQVIPRISSNVSVFVSNRDKDPLGDWLDSCARLKAQIPPDALILPSHQEPFVGIDLRMQQLIDDHHAQLNQLRLALNTALTTDDARKILFARELSTIETLLATGETQSNINYLMHRDELIISQKDDEAIHYQMKHEVS